MGFSTRSLAAGAALLMVFGLGPQALAPSRPGAERGVRLALIRLNGLLSRRDTAVVDEFVAADDTLMIGAQAGERSQGLAQIAEAFQRMFQTPETVSFAWREVDVAVRGDLAWLRQQIDDYAANVGQRPPSLAELRFRTIERFGMSLPRDPWGHPYRYAPGEGERGYELTSSGADGVPSADDVR